MDYFIIKNFKLIEYKVKIRTQSNQTKFRKLIFLMKFMNEIDKHII